MAASVLEQLKSMTVVVADTGDFNSIQKYEPRDSTTNPSLIYSAIQQPEYQPLLEDALEDAKKSEKERHKQLKHFLDKLAVNFGLEILKIIPGRVSTEVDARLSFDKDATTEKARKLISMYQDAGIDSNRILIKIAATWEGIEAAAQLEKEGIHCNLTLLFGMAQAAACAEAGVTLISPFVGRILDWHKKDQGVDYISAIEDPGVISVKHIYQYYKKFGYKTEVMGASFRNVGEIMELAGCDLLTIAPKLLEELDGMQQDLPRVLTTDMGEDIPLTKLKLKEKDWRWLVNQDACVCDLLSDGIRRFSADLAKLERNISDKL